MDDGTPQEPIPKQRESSQANRASLLLWMSILLVLYLLGIGPAARVHLKYPAARPALEVLYAPVVFACNRSPAISNAVLWYLTTIWHLPIP